MKTQVKNAIIIEKLLNFIIKNFENNKSFITSILL